jgi:hypothetical protein
LRGSEIEQPRETDFVSEHVARNPEDVGRTIKDFKWILRVIVRGPQSEG